MSKALIEISKSRQAPEALLAGLLDENGGSIVAGQKLLAKARDAGLGMRDYLTLAIDPRKSENPDRYTHDGKLLGGYEAALAFLNLPIRNDFEHGIVLQAASETFQTFPGTRAMFPEVIDDMMKWQYRQDQFEKAEKLISNSRTISQPELLSTVVTDAQADYQFAAPVAERGRVPVRSIRTSQNTVKIWKHGNGYETTYEFERRAGLDLLTPYAARTEREIEISKVSVATGLLVNGDSVYSAAPVVAQSSFVSGATNGKIHREAFVRWLISRAKIGVPVDTVVGNWDAYIEWLLLWVPVSANTVSEIDNAQKMGFSLGGAPIVAGPVNFVLSSTSPASKLVGYSKSDTLEELVEANSLIQESERSMSNQIITYYRTQNVGYRLVFGDTRSVYNFGA